ncbi:N-acetyltransferase GCN5 [Cupriavidus sp. TA19]|uniref:GNAT family N-acetyltransferase n=1 Tax=unclassified Cupriavidus TaxID=2640874 RepID=UPI000EE97D32|nr:MULTISPECIES: GNAT family N-acetyltransferase [unclassified Cupriavidus]BDB30718.1 GNAT family N-acetyltransferase [Cupriavidus sp. P-10]GLC91818.1 N-acetyltransferase GCN5 [Cupriavidus sp. TA19]
MEIHLLNSSHDRKAFDCGNDEMNAWLRQMARQQADKDLIKIYVATTADEPTKIAGYYAINTTSVLTEGMGGQKLPSNVPAVLLARLAVDASYKGQGLGGCLLMNALELAAETAELVGIRCIVVDAIDDNAAQFYQHYGFEPLTTDPYRLVLHLHTVRTLLQ